MILKALLELARSEGLTENLDYQPMPVRWILTIGREGELHGGFADTMQTPADGKGRPVAGRFEIPKRSVRPGSQNLAEFVIDKAEYVFGWVNEAQVPPEKLEKARQRATARHCVYRDEVRLAANRTSDDGLLALVRFLDHPLPTLPTDLGEGDLIGYQYSADEEVRLITDRPAVRTYWAKAERE